MANDRLPLPDRGRNRAPDRGLPMRFSRPLALLVLTAGLAVLAGELLATADYGRHQADIWYGLLVQRTSDNRRVDFTPTRDWLAAEFNKNRPWGEQVAAILTATGPMSENGAVGFFLSNNTVDKMTDA